MCLYCFKNVWVQYIIIEDVIVRLKNLGGNEMFYIKIKKKMILNFFIKEKLLHRFKISIRLNDVTYKHESLCNFTDEKVVEFISNVKPEA